jgi:hypothetical protein
LRVPVRAASRSATVSLSPRRRQSRAPPPPRAPRPPASSIMANSSYTDHPDVLPHHRLQAREDHGCLRGDDDRDRRRQPALDGAPGAFDGRRRRPGRPPRMLWWPVMAKEDDEGGGQQRRRRRGGDYGGSKLRRVPAHLRSVPL